MKIKILKKEKKFKKGGFHTNPNISWEIVLGVAAFIILILAIFGFYLFQNISRESTLPIADGEKQILIINTDRMEKALNYFSEREKKSAEILNFPVPIVDPSL
jgi:hypothetical protein